MRDDEVVHGEQGDSEGVSALYGEPFDSGFALAEEHQLAADLTAACAVYEELLTVAESIEDSPDVRFLRAHLLSNLASVRLTATDLAGAEDAVERSRALLDGIAAVPMGPRGRQLWLEVLLKTLLATADLRRRTGRLDEALACLDEAAARLPEFDDPEGLRTAELGLEPGASADGARRVGSGRGTRDARCCPPWRRPSWRPCHGC